MQDYLGQINTTNALEYHKKNALSCICNLINGIIIKTNKTVRDHPVYKQNYGVAVCLCRTVFCFVKRLFWKLTLSRQIKGVIL